MWQPPKEGHDESQLGWGYSVLDSLLVDIGAWLHSALYPMSAVADSSIIASLTRCALARASQPLLVVGGNFHLSRGAQLLTVLHLQAALVKHVPFRVW